MYVRAVRGWWRGRSTGKQRVYSLVLAKYGNIEIAGWLELLAWCGDYISSRVVCAPRCIDGLMNEWMGACDLRVYPLGIEFVGDILMGGLNYKF